MIVTCESCGTKFRLQDELLNKPKNKVRCTRCRHIFIVEQPEMDEEDEVLVRVDLDDIGFGENGEIGEDESDDAPLKTAKTRRSLPRKPIAIGAALLVLLAGGFFLFSGEDPSSSSDPAQVEKGAQSSTDQPSVSILDSTNAYFLENERGGQIFVVEGEVANSSSKPISFILIEGKLYTRNNQVAQKQRCFAGNTMTKDELTQLNVTELQNRMMNREGKNLINVHIPASKRVPFMLIFHNLPEMDALGDYSVEVISAKAD